MGHKNFWKLDRNVFEENSRYIQGGMLENGALGSRWSTIAEKKVTKWDEEFLEVE